MIHFFILKGIILSPREMCKNIKLFIKVIFTMCPNNIQDYFYIILQKSSDINIL